MYQRGVVMGIRKASPRRAGNIRELLL